MSNGNFFGISGEYVPPITPNVSCFSEDSKILCIHDDEIYVPIKNIRKGDFVKTFRHGYVKVESIGYSIIKHSVVGECKNQLFRLTPQNYINLNDELVLTGCHSVLVPSLTQEEEEKTIKMLGQLYFTDQYFRLMACIDTRASVVEEEGVYKVWHFALEHEDMYQNYGVYANGLLVESSSKRMMKDYGMTLI